MANKKSDTKRVYIPPKTRGATWPLAICEHCRSEYRVAPSLAQGEKRQRFCSFSCSSRARFAHRVSAREEHEVNVFVNRKKAFLRKKHGDLTTLKAEK